MMKVYQLMRKRDYVDRMIKYLFMILKYVLIVPALHINNPPWCYLHAHACSTEIIKLMHLQVTCRQ